MKKDLIFVIFGFFIFYLSLGLFLPNANGLLLASVYFARFLKYCFGILAYAFLLVFFINYLFAYLDKQRAIRYSVNIFSLVFILFLPFANSVNLGLFSILDWVNYVIILFIILLLVYCNYSMIFKLKQFEIPDLNSFKKTNKNTNIAKTKAKTPNNPKAQNTKEEILSDKDGIRFIRAIDESIEEREIKLEPLCLGEKIDKSIFKEIKTQKPKPDETVLRIDERKEDIKEQIEDVKIVEEQESEAVVLKAAKKVEILSELAENKAILSELELGSQEIPKDFELPNIKLLDKPKTNEIIINEDELDEKINELLAKLKQFKIDGDVVKTYWGPVVTTFEFKPAPNVKLSKISGLADDLAMALKATSIRIQAPIPGKDVVGIEIPNKQAQTINIRTIFEDELFIKSKSKLTIALGKDIVGNTFVTDLKRLPHLLIAGTTGSGKSVGINAMILSLLYKNSPRTLRFLMIDPKMLEFSMYSDIPHLLTPVITSADKAAIALKNMVFEMERRNKLMASTQTKNIESFNEKAPKLGLDPFAYIVIIIDELADLMMTSAKEVECYIARLAQMARAAGIHLIIATQRPSVDVITGLIKANLPSRLSYRVGTGVDSKVIIDTKGAETLLGRGDSLFTPPGTSQIVRLHAPFASEEEIIKVVEHLKTQEEVHYDESILQDMSVSSEFVKISDEKVDELFEEAVKIMRESNKTSISHIQRRLNIGYNRAANIIEQCEQQGILSEPNSKGVRTLL